MGSLLGLRKNRISSNAARFPSALGISLPWPNPHWLDGTLADPRQPGSAQERRQPDPSPVSAIGPSLVISVPLLWAGHRPIASRPNQIHINLLSTGATQSRAVNGPVRYALPDMILRTTMIRARDAVYRSSDAMLLPHNIAAPGQEVLSRDQANFPTTHELPTPLTFAGSAGHLAMSDEMLSAGQFVSQPDLTGLAKPGLQPLTGLSFIFDTLGQMVRREVASAIHREEAKWAVASERPYEIPSATRNTVISDQLGRAITQKLSNLAEEDRFRTGKLR